MNRRARAPATVLARIASAALLGLAPGCDEAPCGGRGVICTLAGTGTAAFDGDGRAATETSLYLPSAVRLGPDARVYVMDFNNMRLRRIDEDGRMSTVVGNGVHAIAAEGALAKNTPLENPIDFRFASDGALVFVSYHDPRVFRLDAKDRVVVLAGSDVPGDDGDGGPALDAHFDELTALALGANGEVYVSDEKRHRVRVVVDGLVQALAGTGEPGYAGDGGPAVAAKLREPSGVTLDTDGALLIADTGNHVVRRVDGAGNITTVAGTGTRGLAGDAGPAILASLDSPRAIAVDERGNIYVADSGNHRIRKIASDGAITTIAGTGAGYAGEGELATEAELRGPRGLEITADRIFFADQKNHAARVIYRTD